MTNPVSSYEPVFQFPGRAHAVEAAGYLFNHFAARSTI
jgi:hypothetical protein